MKNKMTPKQALEEIRFYIPREKNDFTRIVVQAITDYENLLSKHLELVMLYNKLQDRLQNKLQILEVLKNKIVNREDLADFDSYEDYLKMVNDIKEDLEDYENLYALTETEFNLIKEWLK